MIISRHYQYDIFRMYISNDYFECLFWTVILNDYFERFQYVLITNHELNKIKFSWFSNVVYIQNRYWSTTNQNRQRTKHCSFFSSIFISNTINANLLIHSSKKSISVLIIIDSWSYVTTTIIIIIDCIFTLHINHK